MAFDAEDVEKIIFGLVGLAILGLLVWIRLNNSYRKEERAQIHLLSLTFNVFRKDPETLVFSLIAGFFTLIPLAGLVYWAPQMGQDWHLDIAGFFFCLICYIVGSLMSVAVVACSLKRLCGENPTLMDGWRAIKENFVTLVLWSLLSSAVLTALGSLARRFKRFRIFAIVSGALWHMANLFVIPVILVEKKGLTAAIKRSDELVRKHFSNISSLDAMNETAVSLVMGALMCLFFLPLLYMMLPTFGVERVLGFELLPNNIPTYRVLAYVFCIPVYLVICFTAMVVNLNLIFLSAIFLHITAPDQTKKQVERFFPSEVLLQPFRIVARINNPIGRVPFGP